MKKSIRTIQLILAIIFSPTLLAAGGVIEINQVCATQLGCFSGDTSGYPVTITGTAGSSYRLTSDLVLANSNISGISITAPDISIDLNGFSIISQACVGATSNCAPATGNGRGIRVQSVLYNGVSVKNGKVIGMGQTGISLIGSYSRIENVTAQWNRLTGMFVGQNSWVNKSGAFENGGDGIRFGDGANIKDNTAISNGGNGLKGFSSAVIEGNIANDNVADGIFAQGAASVITGNTASSNGNDGIACAFDCLVTNNIVSSNVSWGLNIFFRIAYRDNIIYGNGLAVNGGVNMGGNLCGGAVCP
ncbi:MAG: right-handed parallel beta-helix repeat-containing protein [Xanthomonadales bacterium]|nr:right-handed parallel beta-helix repeat-containing protein [Xanthomonadales bacterium]